MCKQRLPYGDTLYFTASEGIGIIGGTDIYYTVKDGEGRWQTPVNMGV